MLGKPTVAWHEPLLFESRNWASSKSDSEDILVDIPAGNWPDHMELVEGLAELEPELLREH